MKFESAELCLPVCRRTGVRESCKMELGFWRTHWVGTGHPLDSSAALVMCSRKTSPLWTVNHFPPPLARSFGLIHFFSVRNALSPSTSLNYGALLNSVPVVLEFPFPPPSPTQESREKNRDAGCGSYGSPLQPLNKEHQLHYVCLKREVVYTVLFYWPLPSCLKPGHSFCSFSEFSVPRPHPYPCLLFGLGSLFIVFSDMKVLLVECVLETSYQVVL